MSRPSFPYRICPLGDSALTIDFGNCIDSDINKEVTARFGILQKQPLPCMKEALPAYSSLTIYYDVAAAGKNTDGLTAFEWMKKNAGQFLAEPVITGNDKPGIIKIPVCYENEFATDMQQLISARDITAEELVQIHTTALYRVYMLGFLPGFAYMGKVDEKIAMPRKPQPVSTKAGSVGIAGMQTGIYPADSPGGWQIIGRTPLKLFDTTKESPALLKAGDQVQFYQITIDEFEKISSGK